FVPDLLLLLAVVRKVAEDLLPLGHRPLVEKLEGSVVALDQADFIRPFAGKGDQPVYGSGVQEERPASVSHGPGVGREGRQVSGSDSPPERPSCALRKALLPDPSVKKAWIKSGRADFLYLRTDRMRIEVEGDVLHPNAENPLLDIDGFAGLEALSKGFAVRLFPRRHLRGVSGSGTIVLLNFHSPFAVDSINDRSASRDLQRSGIPPSP